MRGAWPAPVVAAPCRWFASGVVLAVSAYLVVVNASGWAWVAESAFTGRRAAADPWLGVKALLAASAPVVGGLVAWRWRRRDGATRAGALPYAAATAAVVALPLLLAVVAASIV